MFAASKSGQSAAAVDPFFRYVPLLLDTTTTNGQQNNTFLDSSTNNFTITRNGTPTQGSVTPYWPNGQWSNFFNGSSDYLTSNGTFSLATTTTPFTLEAWVYFNAFTGAVIVSSGFAGSGAIPFIMGMGTGSSQTAGATPWFGYFNGSSFTTVVQSSTSLVANTWYHLAYVYTGSSATIYANGVSIGTASVSTWQTTGQANFFIGRRWDTFASPYFSGYISNFRFVNGTAVYTSAFTPPTTPLTAITNTSILTCQSSRFIDNSTNARTITPTSTPRVQAFQPFSPAASYTPAAYGGSGYFSTGNYLTAPASTSWQFTGDYTLEAWIYLVSLASDGTIYGTGGVGAADQFTYTSTGQLFWAGQGTSAGTIVTNQWLHVAAARSGTTLKIFVNGDTKLTATVSGTTGQNLTAYIARRSDGNNPVNGYISNLRIVNGTAVYTANFTPPTAPVTAITNTSLLLNFTNAGIYDAAVQNNAITVGDAQASITQSRWSPTSMKFDGTGDWLTTIDKPQLQLGTGDFTIDGWVYLSATGVVYGIISKGAAATGWSVNVTVLNKLQFSYTASNLTGATSLAASTWYYFAVVRSGSATGNLKLYLNGAVDATSGGAVTDNFNQTDILYVGASRIGATPLNGYLQDVRITRLARTITTPTAAFPTR